MIIGFKLTHGTASTFHPVGRSEEVDNTQFHSKELAEILYILLLRIWLHEHLEHVLCHWEGLMPANLNFGSTKKY